MISSLFATLAFLQTPIRLTPSLRAKALEAIEREIRSSYVFPEMRPKMVDKLIQAQKAGRYDTDDPYAFGLRITEDLRAVSRDHHMFFGYEPADYAAALAPPKSDDGIAALTRRRAVRDRYGLNETKILPGNVRYLKIAGFEWVQDETGAVYDDAMRFLRDGDAVVIDLRGNHGGSHAAVQYLVSHFLDPGTLEYTFYWQSDPPSQSRSLEYLPAGRLKGKPLYVLIDGEVGSAAEAFAYDVQQFKLGQLVGAKTVGAANNCADIPVAPCFMLTISCGRPQHAVSQSNWEGIGVKPDIEADPQAALDVAHAEALKRLANAPDTPDHVRGEVEWALVTAVAKIHPVAFTEAQLKSLVGRYGDVEIEMDEQGLTVSRPTHPNWPRRARLTPLTKDGLFAYQNVDFIRLRISGKSLTIVRSDRPPETLSRD